MVLFEIWKWCPDPARTKGWNNANLFWNQELFCAVGGVFRCRLDEHDGAIRTGAQTPSPALLVLEKSDEKLAIVDPATLKVVGRVPSGGAPHEMIASYVALGRDDAVAVIDLKTLEVTRKIATGNGSDGLAWAQGK